MTMDRVQHHHQHGFQHQQQQQQQQHLQPQPPPPSPPPPLQQSQQQQPAASTHPLQQQHPAGHFYRQNHIIQHNNNNSNNSNNNNTNRHHNNQQQQHHHAVQASALSISSLHHRPIHPPPPPPPALQPSSNLCHHPNSNTNHQHNLHHHHHHHHHQIQHHSNQNFAGQESSLISNPHATSNRVGSTESHSRVRSNQHATYYADTHYQLYTPSNLHTIHPQHQQHLHYMNSQHQNHLNTSEHHVTNLVGCGKDSVDFVSSQDHFTEEVIQAILAAKEALEKPIEERDERDILLIDNLCSLVHGFDTFPKSVRRALAAQAVLIVIDEKGKELIVHNEELDSFCVLIFGECEQLNATKTVPIRNYIVGDSFGVCEPTTETIRFVGHMITKCENCAFLCVKRDDFYTILTDPANYPSKDVIRHRDRNGNVVCVSQLQLDKKSSGPIWSYNLQSFNPFKIVLPDGHIIVKATESCLLFSLVDGYDRVDPDYVDDFLLLFRVFMTHDHKDKEKKLPPGMIKLCLALAKWLDVPKFGDKVVKIVLTWLSSYYHDFELNSDFSYLFFKLLESRLFNLKMNNQLHLLHATLSTKSKTRHVTISRSSREQPLAFSISGGYEKNCGIFVTQLHGYNCDECPYSSLMNYLKYSNITLADISRGGEGGITVPPRHKTTTTSQDAFSQPHQVHQHHSRISVPLRPGDQILEVNGTNFAAIKLIEAQKKLDMSTHLSLTVKYNPSAFHEMRALPEGRRKSSLSSVSSVSPYLPPNSQTKFTFNLQDANNHQNNSNRLLVEQHLPPSPLFSSNVNFGFKSIIKNVPRNDRSRLSSLINSSKQFVKQIRDSTAQSSSNNIETISKTSNDNVSDDQSNDVDIGKAKSNPDLSSVKSSKDRQLTIDAALSNIIRLDDLNPASITEQASNGALNQTLVNVVRVFNAANNDFRYLLIHEETTAREVVMVAVKEFNLTGSNSSPGDKSAVSSLNWHLYEVSVVPESKTIKQKCLSEQTSRLAERASLCSRFYIKNNSQSSFGPTRLDMGDDALVNEILKESPANVTLTSLNATLLAVELTLNDFDKFKSIEPQQFVYDTFFDFSEKSRQQQTNGMTSSSTDSSSLKSSSSDGQDAPDMLQLLNKTRSIPKSWMEEYQQFADLSNKEMFWVVCEILSERNIGRRVKIVKQFIHVADVCSQLRNYNSMFAIISGLGHSCVNRLRRTFDKLKPKYKNQLEKMRSLFDPSKNMLNYRSCLSKTPPPAIPLFPQIKKDLTFTKEGRTIFVRECDILSDDDDDGANGGGTYSQETIKRRSLSNLLTVKQAADQALLNQPPPRSISYATSSFESNNKLRQLANNNNDNENILVNFAEVRQFTERVRNVIYFSSVPYSNDLLTNSKDNQRNQAQIKKMHEEWQMRKRIRHYISNNLNCAEVHKQQKSEGGKNQPDSSSTTLMLRSGPGGKLTITYDERILYQRSLDVEPELNTRTQVSNLVERERSNGPNTHTISHHHPPPSLPPSVQLIPQIVQLQPPTVNLHMHPPPSAANSSPTLSKSSSLSSCSSFNHHLPNYHATRPSLNSNVGKFGTESTESLRKLQALSENMDDWRPFQSIAGTGSTSSTSAIGNSNMSNGIAINNNRFNLASLQGGGGSGSLVGDQATRNSTKTNLVPARMFPPKTAR